MKCDIILAGVGGQGILSIAFILDNAAMKQGFHFKQSEVHGMAQRGGAVQSHLRIADREIHSDLIPKGTADIILSVEPLEALRYKEYLSDKGILVSSTKPFVNIPDYPPIEMILNEIEAGRTAGYEVRERSGELSFENLKKTLKKLIESGESELVCIHFPEGAYAVQKGEKPHFVPSHLCPEGFIASTVGAGDAFCAGMLFGIHEGWELDRTMRFANAMAAMCLTDMTTSGGMKSMEDTLKLMEEVPLRDIHF